jgi:hypothetical protein
MKRRLKKSPGLPLLFIHQVVAIAIDPGFDEDAKLPGEIHGVPWRLVDAAQTS